MQARLKRRAAAVAKAATAAVLVEPFPPPVGDQLESHGALAAIEHTGAFFQSQDYTAFNHSLGIGSFMFSYYQYFEAHFFLRILVNYHIFSVGGRRGGGRHLTEGQAHSHAWGDRQEERRHGC